MRTTIHGVPIEATGPSEVFGQYKWTSQNIPDSIIHRSLNQTSTLLIGAGDLTALSLGMAGFYAWGGPSMNLWHGCLNEVPIFYFCNTNIFGANIFYNVLMQLQVPSHFRSPDMPLNQIGGIQYYPFYRPELTLEKSSTNFRWLCCNDGEEYMPWTETFLHELARMSPLPQILFLNGALDHVKRTNNALLKKISHLLNKLKSLQQMGVLMTAPSHLKSRQLYRMFENIIEVKPWRTHKCGERCLTLSYIKINGGTPGFFLKQRVKSPKDKIVWTISHKNSIELFLKVRLKMELQHKTAKQIVEELNMEGLKISLPQLVKLKRSWGLKIYKKHQHRRKSLSSSDITEIK